MKTKQQIENKISCQKELLITKPDKIEYHIESYIKALKLVLGS